MNDGRAFNPSNSSRLTIPRPSGGSGGRSRGVPALPDEVHRPLGPDCDRRRRVHARERHCVDVAASPRGPSAPSDEHELEVHALVPSCRLLRDFQRLSSYAQCDSSFRAVAGPNPAHPVGLVPVHASVSVRDPVDRRVSVWVLAPPAGDDPAPGVIVYLPSGVVLDSSSNVRRLTFWRERQHARLPL